MNRKLACLMATGLGAGVLTSLACIQTMRMPAPRNPAQLPADIFKVHVHIDMEPLTLDLPTIGGTTTKMSINRPVADPQGEYLAVIAQYEAAPDQHRTFADRNDYAAALLFAGRPADAVAVLTKLETDFPDKYSTAANLGTAYELLGDLPNATIWIRKGMERNKDSHQGTEWLHLAILATKQKLQEDPTWLVSHSVLDGYESRSRAEKEQALEYQLNERLYFIHSNDPVMCDLFYQAAAVTTDSAKREYFLRQLPRFGNIREGAAARLPRLG